MVLVRTKSTMAAKITAGWLTDETYSVAGMTEREEDKDGPAPLAAVRIP